MSNYEVILGELKKFYDVNNKLRRDLNRFCKEQHKISLDEFFEAYAKKYAESEQAQGVIEYLEFCNEEPHCISDMEEMYEIIEYFEPKEVIEK